MNESGGFGLREPGMPKTVKNCILCSYWIARSRRRINSLCVRCIRKINERFKRSLARQRKEREKQRDQE